jgi:hypothetical protein
MMAFQEFELLFDKTIEADLLDRQVDVENEIHRIKPELKVHQGRSKAVGTENQRDVVTIVTAAAALAPLVVPIVTEIIKRKLPHVESETIIEEGADGRRVIRLVRKET